MLNIEDRRRDQPAFSVQDQHGGTYNLIVEDGDWLAFSMQEKFSALTN
jgi:hypothetical protein